MKPRDAVRKALEMYVVPRLARLNFTFAPSTLSLMRKREMYRQIITCELDRWNMEDISASFGLRFSVRSAFYNKWHQNNFGDRPPNDALASELYMNLKGWMHAKPNVAHAERVEIEMLKLMEDILDRGLPFLEKYSDWENAAQRLVKGRWMWAKACDFYVIAGNREKARETLELAERNWKERPKSFFLGEKEDVETRFQKFFGIGVTLN